MHVDPRHSIYRACRYSIGDKLTVPLAGMTIS